jgi:hypothetical protein
MAMRISPGVQGKNPDRNGSLWHISPVSEMTATEILGSNCTLYKGN